MTTDKPKFFERKWTKIAFPILRGVVKQVPIIGNPIAEIVTNLTQPKTMVATIADSTVQQIVEKPLKHDWISIIAQVIMALSILYAFLTKTITVEQLIEFIKQFLLMN